MGSRKPFFLCFAVLMLFGGCHVQVGATPFQDLVTLLAFKSSLLSYEASSHVALWNVPSSSRTDSHAAALEMCSTWPGLTCSADGRVTGIWLPGQTDNFSMGALPVIFSRLEYLEQLDLSGNQYSGSIPPEWANLRRLKRINLSDNKISGGLPESWSELVGLSHFNVSRNRLAGSIPGTWSTLENLRELDLSNNQFSGSLSSSGMTALGTGWSELRLFSLDNNRFSGTLPPEMSAFRSLQTLSVSGNRLEGTLPNEWASGALSSVLIEFDASNNQLEGTLPEQWATGMRQLTTVNLRLNSLNGPLPDVWRELSRLQILDLSRNSIRGGLPPRWALLSSLNVLDLANNDLSGTLPWVWGVMSNLRHLILSDNQLTGDLPPSWSQMVGMRSLRMQSNLFSGRINTAASWSSMTSLTHIELNSNRLSGSIPTLWKNFPSLKQVELQENNLRGELPASWGSGSISSVLEHLDVHENGIQGNLPDAWSSMSRLTKLRASENNLQGSVPSTWEKLVSLRELNLDANEGMVADAIPRAIARRMDVCPTCGQGVSPGPNSGASLSSPDRAVGQPDRGGSTATTNRTQEEQEADENGSEDSDGNDAETTFTESAGGDSMGDREASSETPGFVYDSEVHNSAPDEDKVMDRARESAEGANGSDVLKGTANSGNDDDGTTLGVIVGVAVSVLLLIALLVIIITVYRLGRKKRRKAEQAKSKAATTQRPLRVPTASRAKLENTPSKKQYGSADGVVLVSVNTSGGTPKRARQSGSRAQSISSTPSKPVRASTPRLVYDQQSPAITPRATPVPSPNLTPRTSLQNGLPVMTTPRGTRVQTSLYYAPSGQPSVATPRYSPSPAHDRSNSGGVDQLRMSTPRLSCNSGGTPPQYGRSVDQVASSREFLLKSNELANLYSSSERSELTFQPQGNISQEWAHGSRHNNDVYVSRDGLMASTDLTSSKDIRIQYMAADSPGNARRSVEPYVPPMSFALDSARHMQQQNSTQLSAVQEASFEVSVADITASTHPDTSHYNRSPQGPASFG